MWVKLSHQDFKSLHLKVWSSDEGEYVKDLFSDKKCGSLKMNEETSGFQLISCFDQNYYICEGPIRGLHFSSTKVPYLLKDIAFTGLLQVNNKLSYSRLYHMCSNREREHITAKISTSSNLIQGKNPLTRLISQPFIVPENAMMSLCQSNI